jgi:HK97 family phage portal protein
VLNVLSRNGTFVSVNLERRGAPGNLPWGDSTPPTNGSLGNPTSGTVVTEKGALGLAAVWSCTTLLADEVASLPLYESTGDSIGNRKRVPLEPVLEDPYSQPGFSRYDWWAAAQMSIDLRGNFFGLVVDRDKRMYPTQIQPWHPDKVRVQRLTNGEIEYRYGGTTVDIDDVFHVRGYSMPGQLVGMNPIEVLRNTFGMARAADLYGGAFFANSAFPSGVITVEEDLGEEETLNLLRSWVQAHQGIGQAHLPAVLTGGAEFHALSLAPEDAQFIESRQLGRSEVQMIFRIPPHMTGDVDKTTSWGTGVEEQELGFTIHTLAGKLARWKQAFEAIMPPGRRLGFDMSHRLRGSTLQRFQAYTLARNGGWMNVDDIRAKEDEAPLPDGLGQTYLQPLNFTPLGPPGMNPGAPMPNPMAPPPKAPVGGQSQGDQLAQIQELETTLRLLEESRARETAEMVERAAADAVEERRRREQVEATAARERVQLEARLGSLTEAVAALATRELPPVIVNSPAVTVEPAQVTVEPAQVFVTVEPAQVNIPPPPPSPPLARSRRVERDVDGNIARIVEED